MSVPREQSAARELAADPRDMSALRDGGMSVSSRLGDLLTLRFTVLPKPLVRQSAHTGWCSTAWNTFVLLGCWQIAHRRQCGWNHILPTGMRWTGSTGVRHSEHGTHTSSTANTAPL